MEDSQKSHFSGVAILHSRRDLYEHTRSDGVLLIVYDEVSASGENIVSASNLLTHHEHIVALFHFDVIDIQLLLVQRAERIS